MTYPLAKREMDLPSTSFSSPMVNTLNDYRLVQNLCAFQQEILDCRGSRGYCAVSEEFCLWRNYLYMTYDFITDTDFRDYHINLTFSIVS